MEGTTESLESGVDLLSMVCVDQENLTMYGNIGAGESRTLSILLERCYTPEYAAAADGLRWPLLNGRSDCKSDAEIDFAFAGGILAMINNQRTFDQKK